MDKELDRFKKDTIRYWFEDGLSDIVIGSLFFIVGGLTVLQGLLEPGSALTGFYGMLIFVVILAGTPLSRRLIRTLKERFTYPRTGYIAYKAPSSLQRIVSLILAIIFSIIVLLLVIASSLSQITWLPTILGIMLAAILSLIGYRNAVIRYQLMAVGVAGIGFLLSLFNAVEWLSIGIMLSSCGLALMLSGLITLFRYLHNTQPDHGAADGS
jgi:hypothetical protein